ncbi:MAG: polysaccharide biosynthesis/export family protein [Planctomycetota bacterium]
MASAIATGLLVGGCQQIQDALKTDKYRFFQPNRVVEPPERPAVNPILASIGMGDPHQELVPNATFPREGDWSYSERDYIIGAEDVLDISVLDLFQQGLETVLRRQVSTSGYIDMPLLPERVKAEGLTARQLKEAVKDAYTPDVLRDPTVSISVVAKRQNTFSVLGAIQRPGTYNVIRKDMRLLEAVATAGGISQTNIEYLYVIRPQPARAETPAEARPDEQSEAELPEIPAEAEPAQPETQPGEPTGEPTDTETEAALEEIERLLGGDNGTPSPPPEQSPSPSAVPRWSEASATGPSTGPSTAPSPTGGDSRRVKWIYSDGRWIPVEEEAPPAPEPSGRGAERVRPAGKRPRRPETGTPRHPRSLAPRDQRRKRDPFSWEEVTRSDMARIIAINLKKLRAGDPRMNIVIRSNDIIHVPTLEVGEFYVGGDVLRPGVYSLTGRNVTVKQAVTAAGNLGPLAWPEHSVLIRRLGGEQEQIVSLDLEAIFQGDEPDLFLRPDDMIVVGTDPRASFYAVMRNAFRMTYGFGFIYDRNFADPQFTTPTSRRFTRW